MKQPNYYKEAFLEIPSIVIFALTFILFVLNWRSPAFILLISNLALVYSLAKSLTYKTYVNNKLGYKGYTSNDQVIKESRRKIFDLPTDIRLKCQKLEDKYQEIQKKLIKNSELSVMLKDEENQLEYLLDNYIEFQSTLSVYKNYLDENNVNDLMQEINNLKHRISSCFDDVKHSNNLDLYFQKMQKKTLLKNNLDILEKRFEKIHQIQSLSESLKVQADVIEDTFHLISDHIVTMGSGVTSSIDVKNIIKDVEKTSRVVKDTQEEMSKLKKISNSNSMRY